MKVCLGCGCYTNTSRCPPCQRQHKAKYGPDHQAERRRWQPLVDTGTVHCWRPQCGKPITDPGPDGHVIFDLGHRGNAPSHPEHPRCNRSAQ